MVFYCTQTYLIGSLSGACYRARQPMYCRDTRQYPRVAREAADRVGFRSGLLVSLIHEDRCFGVLTVMPSVSRFCVRLRKC